MSLTASLGNWSAVQMWARAIAPCTIDQLQGFPILKNTLAMPIQAAGVRSTVIETLRSGRPAEVSWALLGIRDSRLLTDLDRRINSGLSQKLKAEALRLDATFHQPPLSAILGWRKSVSYSLGRSILASIPGHNSMEKSYQAERRTTLAVNEAVPYAARFLSDSTLEGLRTAVFADIPRDRALDVLAAAELYLENLRRS